ncbi:MAG TPA: hypothetical protein VLU25_18730 [Acidobacteriota bacterium]|nr:hypothetical protein [Acidobacteriota bacterium]
MMRFVILWWLRSVQRRPFSSFLLMVTSFLLTLSTPDLLGGEPNPGAAFSASLRWIATISMGAIVAFTVYSMQRDAAQAKALLHLWGHARLQLFLLEISVPALLGGLLAFLTWPGLSQAGLLALASMAIVYSSGAAIALAIAPRSSPDR